MGVHTHTHTHTQLHLWMLHTYFVHVCRSVWCQVLHIYLAKLIRWLGYGWGCFEDPWSPNEPEFGPRTDLLWLLWPSYWKFKNVDPKFECYLQLFRSAFCVSHLAGKRSKRKTDECRMFASQRDRRLLRTHVVSCLQNDWMRTSPVEPAFPRREEATSPFLKATCSPFKFQLDLELIQSLRFD